MKITIYCENKKVSKSYEKALLEYIKRLSPFCELSINTFKQKSINKNDYILCVNSVFPQISSLNLADKIKHITTYENSKISIVLLQDINEDIKDFSNDFFCLSNFDLSNETSLLLMVEQIYRAFTIINGKKYHK